MISLKILGTSLYLLDTETGAEFDLFPMAGGKPKLTSDQIRKAEEFVRFVNDVIGNAEEREQAAYERGCLDTDRQRDLD